MRSERLLLLYNEPALPAGHPEAESESEILEAVEQIHGILDEGGFAIGRLGVGNDLQVLIDGLRDERPAAVFNLFEGLADRPFTESVVAGMLEWFDIPFTGSPAETLSLARDKRRAKHLMHGAGLPTAPFFAVEQLPVPKCTLPWPVIVKPAAQDASVGIDQNSVVTNQQQLESRVAHVLERYGTALVEQFIAGREFQLSLIETSADAGGRRLLEVLPPAEIEFSDPSLWPIVSYDAKWSPDSAEYRATPVRIAAATPEEWRRQLDDLARRAYRLLGCRDYARVDLRVTPEGRAFILEINPNPCINGSELMGGLQALNRSHSGFIRDLIQSALDRGTLTAGRRVPAARAGAGGEICETA
jgi:D-alanine-D-alanine ligase